MTIGFRFSFDGAFLPYRGVDAPTAVLRFARFERPEIRNRLRPTERMLKISHALNAAET